MSYKPRHAKHSVMQRRTSAVVGSTAAAAALMVLSPSTASAADFSIPGLDLSRIASAANATDAVQARNTLVSQAEQLLPAAEAQEAVRAIDSAVEAAFPGALAEQAAPAPAPEQPAPAPAPKPAEPAFDRGSCPVTADACVDIDGGRSWLQEDGKVTHVAPSSAGAPTNESQTPRGTFTVQRKVKDEVSREFNNAPMPNSVYFTNNGHAFHAGEVGKLSNGCIHLNYDDSEIFFNSLEQGDTVYIY